MGQKNQLWWDLPAMDSLVLNAEIYGVPPGVMRSKVDELSSLMDVGHRLHAQVRELSLGERMKFELIACLLHDPKVLFLDEPTIGLDIIAKQQIRAIVRELNENEGVTVLLTSHDAGDVEQLCKRVVVINRGQVVFDDRVSTLRRRYLRRKVIDLQLRDEGNGAPALPELAGVSVLKRTRLGTKLEVDTEVRPIAEVVAQMVAALPIADVTIQDPPMEEIIAAIYRDEGAGERAG